MARVDPYFDMMYGNQRRRPPRLHGCDCADCLYRYIQELKQCGCNHCYYEMRYAEDRLRCNRHVSCRPVERIREVKYVTYDEASNIDLKALQNVQHQFLQEYPATIKQAKQLTTGDKMNIVEKVKNLRLSAADKLLRKHGVVDAEGDLTETGQELIWDKLLAQYKDELVKDLKAVDTEAKEKK